KFHIERFVLFRRMAFAAKFMMDNLKILPHLLGQFVDGFGPKHHLYCLFHSCFALIIDQGLRLFTIEEKGRHYIWLKKVLFKPLCYRIERCLLLWLSVNIKLNRLEVISLTRIA